MHLLWYYEYAPWFKSLLDSTMEAQEKLLFELRFNQQPFQTTFHSKLLWYDNRCEACWVKVVWKWKIRDESWEYGDAGVVEHFNTYLLHQSHFFNSYNRLQFLLSGRNVNLWMFLRHFYANRYHFCFLYSQWSPIKRRQEQVE